MGHSVQALIVPESLSSLALAELAHTRAVPLRQGFRIVPITGAALDALRAQFPFAADPSVEEESLLSGPLIQAVERLSVHGMVAYVETDYFGGTGSQVAALWEAGALRMAPARAEIGPINAALRLMGVQVGSARDELAAIGLDAERSNERWLARGSGGASIGFEKE